MSFKNDVGAVFNEVSGERKWYLQLGINKDQASVLKNRDAKGSLSVKSRAKMLETLGYGFVATKEAELKLIPDTSLEENINTIFSEVASQRLWHEGLGLTPQQASLIKFHFSTDKLSLDAQIEILEKLGYSIHIIKTMLK